MRPKRKSRIEKLADGVRNGTVSVSRAREKLGLPPLADCNCGAWMSNGTAHRPGCPLAPPLDDAKAAGEQAAREVLAGEKTIPQALRDADAKIVGPSMAAKVMEEAAQAVKALAAKLGGGTTIEIRALDAASFERVLSSPKARAAVERAVARHARRVVDEIRGGRGPRPVFDDAHLKLIHRMTYLGWEPSDEVVPRREIRSALDAYFGSDRAHLKGTGVR